MRKKIEMHATYETDNIEQARLVASSHKNVSVVYSSHEEIPTPVLTLKLDGKSYTKWNPEYVEYLRKKHPGISDAEIAKCIEESVAESLSENNEIKRM